MTKKGHRLPKIMRGARSLVNTSKLMFQKKTVSLVGKMETWYFFLLTQGKIWTGFLSLLVYLFSERPNMKINFHVCVRFNSIFKHDWRDWNLFTQLRQPYTKDSLWCSWTWSNALVATLLEKRLSDKLYIRTIWFYSNVLMIMRRSWHTKESCTSSSQIYTRYDMCNCFLRLNFTHVKITLKSLRRPIQK